MKMSLPSRCLFLRQFYGPKFKSLSDASISKNDYKLQFSKQSLHRVHDLSTMDKHRCGPGVVLCWGMFYLKDTSTASNAVSGKHGAAPSTPNGRIPMHTRLCIDCCATTLTAARHTVRILHASLSWCGLMLHKNQTGLIWGISVGAVLCHALPLKSSTALSTPGGLS